MTYQDIKDVIKSNSAGIRAKNRGGSGVYYGNKSHIGYDICFAGMDRILNGQTTPELFYLLWVRKETDIFDYKALIKELNIIFHDYLEIKIYCTKINTVKLIYMREKKTYYDPYLKTTIYTILGVLLRMIDSEFINKFMKFKKSIEELENLPMDNWTSILAIFYTGISSTVHGVNENLSKIEELVSKLHDKINRHESFKIFTGIYIKNLTFLFGSNFDYEAHMTKNRLKFPNVLNDNGRFKYYIQGQTACYTRLMEIVNDNKR